MERLTAQWGENHAVPTKFDLDDFALKLENPEWDGFTKILDRLAAYEETGLEPDEIPHWIPVSERLPKEGGTFIVCTSYRDVFIAEFWLERKEFTRKDGSNFMFPVACWQPLPQPPKEEK